MKSKSHHISTFALALLFGLFSGTATLNAAPDRPGSVDPKATFYTASKVWFLTAGGTRSVWYSNGKLMARGPYDGARQGNWTFYHSNGQKKAEGQFKNGKMTGKWVFYYTDGVKKSEGEYTNNYKEGQWVLFDSKGRKTSEGPYRGGYKHGTWTEYYPGGGIFSKGEYVRDIAHGQWTFYFKEGQLYQSGRYNAEKRTGPWKICIHPGGPCGTEDFTSPAAPRISGLGTQTTTPASNTQDPADLLDSMEGNGNVPPSMEGKWNSDF
ncbi:MAG: toxin-antitoxin system YwqK family antitoxin [Leptospiraceae bacterium]|nr:toxin-antitoxin system YwqK family antitoxin [Leptospiraceae bacterium]